MHLPADKAFNFVLLLFHLSYFLMPLPKMRQSPLPASVDNTGFSASPASNGGRLIGRDGIPNIRRTGFSWWRRFSMYHKLLRLSKRKFLLLVAVFYSTVNLIFASFYYALGPGHLSNTDESSDGLMRFVEAFFFSSQTLTTVGFGRVAPVGIPASAIAAVESLSGVLLFALVTGVVYARFARPRAHLLFSPEILIAPYRGGKALMLRLVAFKNSHLTDAEAVMTASMQVTTERGEMNRFYTLKLELSRISALALSWTLVHSINEESPFWGMDESDFMTQHVEVFITVKAFDDHFSNTVQQRTSYNSSEVVWNARFLPMFRRDEAAGDTELMLDRIGAYELTGVPAEHP